MVSETLDAYQKTPPNTAPTEIVFNNHTLQSIEAILTPPIFYLVWIKESDE